MNNIRKREFIKWLERSGFPLPPFPLSELTEGQFNWYGQCAWAQRSGDRWFWLDAAKGCTKREWMPSRYGP